MGRICDECALSALYVIKSIVDIICMKNELLIGLEKGTHELWCIHRQRYRYILPKHAETKTKLTTILSFTKCYCVVTDMNMFPLRCSLYLLTLYMEKENLHLMPKYLSFSLKIQFHINILNAS